jgi:hypothetical protein
MLPLLEPPLLLLPLPDPEALPLLELPPLLPPHPVHAPYPWPFDKQTCTPVGPPPGQAQETCCPGVQALPGVVESCCPPSAGSPEPPDVVPPPHAAMTTTT